MKKETRVRRRRIRDKAAKRWVKDRNRIFPATGMLMLLGFAIGGQIASEAFGREHAMLGFLVGTIGGFVVASAYFTGRTG